MSGPGNQRAAAQHRGQLRASHADREQAIEQLKAAFVDGKLTKDEFDLRVGQTLASRTYADLTAVTSDLHARPAAVAPVAARPPRPPRPSSSPGRTLAKAARRSGVCLLAAFVIVGVLAMTTNGDGGPSAFLAFFCGHGGNRGVGPSGVRGGRRLAGASLPCAVAAAAEAERQATRRRAA
jgi:DUF1707 SHOCT-like domain